MTLKLHHKPKRLRT